MSRAHPIAPGELYHVYNRGTEKRPVFMRAADYDRFVELLYFCNSAKAVHIDDLRKNLPASQGPTLRSTFGTFDRGEPLVDLCAYCLMPNHFHLLIKERSEGGLGRFMQKLSTGYTMYFNTRGERTGALFQGRYKTKHVTGDRQLKYLLSYIHLNPVKRIEPGWKESEIKNRRRAERYLSRYAYSSFPDYCGTERSERHLLSMDTLRSYWDAPVPRTFKDNVRAWLTAQPTSEPTSQG